MNQTSEFSFILKASKISGNGVFALHDIQMGTFLEIKPHTHIGRTLTKDDIPSELLQYCIENEDGTYNCPPEFNHMHLVWFLNHSLSPNAELIDEGYYALRDIKKGEEIVINYKKFNEPSYAESKLV